MNWLFELPSPFRYLFVLPVEFGIIALVAFALKKIGVNVKTAWLQGIKNAFFTSLVMCVVGGAIAIIPLFGFGASTYDSLNISYGIMFGAIFCWAYFKLFSNKQKAGQELLDIAPIQNGVMFFIAGIIAIIIGMLGFADFIGKDTKFSWLISAVIGLSSGAYFVYMGFSRIQVYENGILVYVDLIKWSKIESFEWVDDKEKTCTLKLRHKGKMPAFLRNGAVPVPVEKKAQLASLLEQFLSEIVLMQNRA